MLTVVIILGMLLSFSIGAYTGIKSVQMGLKFQVQIEKNIEPVMDKPVKEFFNAKSAKKAANNTNEMISDILGGDF